MCWKSRTRLAVWESWCLIAQGCCRSGALPQALQLPEALGVASPPRLGRGFPELSAPRWEQDQAPHSRRVALPRELWRPSASQPRY